MSQIAFLFLAPGFSRDFCSIFIQLQNSDVKLTPQGGDGNEF